eukprot:CAMPEP_0177762252 /NCGR_PEP_ID=MMETSP0491_2-20121128/6244_1 /TAXON_ID=63592 /ORGANISM="Tetraselmis chuii, Strain PLY429" /LENGTH=846 /DNA_ID=CAMNT_0019278291 /DNA_START=238 /DNA_END=2778 /DNA_ORIENTATION=+
MALSFSLRKFPGTGEIKASSGLPFGCVVQPFAQFERLPATRCSSVEVEDIARCSECFAYVNKFCFFEKAGWVCSLCGNFTEYSGYLQHRYSGHSSKREQLPELQDGLVELSCNAKAVLSETMETMEFEERGDSIPADIKLIGRPVYVAFVDVACDEEYLELVKSALLAALEALPPVALFGVITFSDKLGLYDLQGNVPLVKYVPLLDASSGSPTPVELLEAMPLTGLLAPVGKFKDNIYMSLEALEVDVPTHDGPRNRGFGGAIQAVLRLLSGLPAAEGVGKLLKDAQLSGMPPLGKNWGSSDPAMIGFAGAQMMCFLSGPPTFGPGRVSKANLPTSRTASYDQASPDIDTKPSLAFHATDPSFPINAAVPTNSPPRAASRPAENAASHVTLQVENISLDCEAKGFQEVVDPRGSIFYEEAAAAAAALGISIDLYVISSEVVGLECLSPLASSSGGHLCWYPGIEDAALPQDVYRRLAGIQARNCRLRLRTSAEFHVQRCYGHLMPDQNYKNLQHIVSCSSHDCFAFDFEFGSAAGFLGEEEFPPTLQLAFQYTMLVPFHCDTPDDSNQTWYRLERRVRIHTVQVAIARSPAEVYNFADAESILALLMHKIVRACQDEGLAEARSLLQDWLVILLAHYNNNSKSGRTEKVDVAFESCTALQPMARLVYVLLQSPLLFDGNGADRLDQPHPDLRCYLQNLWASLPPADLLRAVYPVLSSWSDPDTQAYPKHSLSRTAIVASGAPIFLLDSFSHLLVYYTQGCSEELPFPPPQSSKLRQLINHLRLNRIMAPQVKLLRGGVDDVSLFTRYLIEEADSSAAQTGAAQLGTFVSFLEQVRSEVQCFLQAQ